MDRRSALSQDTKLSAQKIWRVLDTEGKGQLSLDAFVKSLAKLDPNLSTRQSLDRILPLLDKDHRGYVGYDEFVSAYEQMLDEEDEASDTAKDGEGEDDDREESFEEEETFTFDREGKIHSRLQIMASLEGLEEKFKELDDQNKGYLNQAQFHQLLNQHFSSPDTSEEEMNAQIATLWKEMEKDSKGTVTFKELAHALTPQDDGGRGARPGMVALASPRRPGSSQSSSPSSTNSRLVLSQSPVPSRQALLSLSPTPFLKVGSPETSTTTPRRRTTQFHYDPQPTVQDPVVQKLMNSLRKLKKRNLNLLEMEAVAELSHINALRLVPFELFANIVEQVVEKKKDNPDMPIVGKDVAGAPADDRLKYKEQTRQLNQKNKALTKRLEQIQKISSTVDHENHELTKKNQDLEDKLKTADRKIELQNKSFEDQKRQMQADAAEWKKKHDLLAKEHAETVRKLNMASSNEKKQKMTITKLRSMLDRLDQSGKSKASPLVRSHSLSGTPPTPPQENGALDIEKEDAEELRRKLSLMEQDREEHLRLIGSLQGSLKEKSPFKLADDSVSEQMDVVALNAELSRLRQQFKEMTETHTRDIANRDSELQTKLTAIDRLREEIRQLKTQKQQERIVEKIVHVQSPAENLTSDATKRQLESSIAALEKANAEKDLQITRLERGAQDQLQAKDAQIASLEKELIEKLQGKDAQLSRLERESQDKLSAKDLQIARLERDVERAQTGKDSQLQEKLQLKELQISRLEKEIERLQQTGKDSALPRSDSQLARLRKEMERGLGEKDLQILKLEKELERTLGEKDLQIVKLQKELEKAIGDKDLYIAKLEREGANLRRELETQRDSNHSVLEELRVHAIQLEERLSQANAAMQNAIRERQRAEDEANEAWTELRKRREEETYYIAIDQKAPSEALKAGGAMKQFPDPHSAALMRGETYQPEVSQAYHKASVHHKDEVKPIEARPDVLATLPDSPPPKANLQKGPSHTRIPTHDPRTQIQDPPWAGGPTAKTPLLASGKRDQERRCCCSCCSCAIL